MKRYEQVLIKKGHQTLYLDYDPKPGSLQRHLKRACSDITSSPKSLIVADPTDFILEKRLQRICQQLGVAGIPRG